MTQQNWTQDNGLILSVADYGIEVGEFITAVELIRFFEKPWNYQELYEAWVESMVTA